jgi:sec-independent protein translocase protein TatB
MFDIGFAELVLIAVVGLLVIGPERLPGAIRTLSFWLNRIKRGFNEIKQEVERELHNDAVMQELRKTGEQIREQTDGLSREVRSETRKLSGTVETENPAEPGSDSGTPKE